MNANALRSRALYQDVADWLRQKIFARELEPGAWIDEAAITQALGISRTPLREALKVLAAEGLITMKVRRGAYVTEVSEQDLREVYELLALLEADAAGVVATQANDEELQSLRQLQAQLEAATDDREAFFRINEAFHLRLLDIANNRWRNQMVADLRKVMKLNRHQSLFKSGRMAQSLAEHAAIVEALMARNPAAATERMRNHFANGLQAAGQRNALD